jgi:hypothetical protein
VRDFRLVTDIELIGDPEVERWPARPDLFIVTYPITGPRGYKDFEDQVRQRLGALGVKTVSYFPDSLKLYGVQKGREAAIHAALVELVTDENLRRERERDEEARVRPEREARTAAAKAEVDDVQEAFRKARQEETTDESSSNR